MSGYSVALVGVSRYQPAIKRLSIGDRVTLAHERGNPHDKLALIAIGDRNETLGYVARDNWLKRAVFEEGKGARAAVRVVGISGAGLLGVVLDVTLRDDGFLPYVQHGS